MSGQLTAEERVDRIIAKMHPGAFRGDEREIVAAVLNASEQVWTDARAELADWEVRDAAAYRARTKNPEGFMAGDIVRYASGSTLYVVGHVDSRYLAPSLLFPYYGPEGRTGYKRPTRDIPASDRKYLLDDLVLVERPKKGTDHV